MLGGVLTAVASLPPDGALAASRHLYPLLKTAHIIGLATLFGSIVALDLRLLGFFRSVPALPLARTLPFVATGGLVIALATGVLLFSLDPDDYLANPVFRAKMIIVVLGVIHTVAINFMAEWKALMRDGTGIGVRLRLAAALSLVLWTSAIVAGRLIAFWG